MSDRKNNPVFSGVFAYFPDAIVAVSQHSKKGNDKHNPGLPLHWDKTKSMDHADALGRHLLDIGPNWDLLDEDTGSYHAVSLAWRSLALLQTLLDRKKNERSQKVKFKLDDKEVEAVIDEKAKFGEEKLWWIKVGHGSQLIEESALRPMQCTCGAVATYFPNTPPGHGYRCDASI